jgi:hypothetical protein
MNCESTVVPPIGASFATKRVLARGLKNAKARRLRCAKGGVGEENAEVAPRSRVSVHFGG